MQALDGYDRAKLKVIADQLHGEFRWLCDYPEFNDLACIVSHKPEMSSQPHKHSECGWHLCIPLEPFEL